MDRDEYLCQPVASSFGHLGRHTKAGLAVREAARERKLCLAALGRPSTHWASLGNPHHEEEFNRPDDVEASGSYDHEKVHFPLKREIQSQALVPGADTGELWQKLGSIGLFSKPPLPTDLK